MFGLIDIQKKLAPLWAHVLSVLTLEVYSQLGIGLVIVGKQVLLKIVPKIFPIMPKYQPIVLKIILECFSYCIIYHKITR